MEMKVIYIYIFYFPLIFSCSFAFLCFHGLLGEWLISRMTDFFCSELPKYYLLLQENFLPGLRGSFHLSIFDEKRPSLIYIFRVWTTWSMGERGSWPRRDSSPALPASSSHGLSSTLAFTHSQPLLQVQVTAWEGPGWTCLLISFDDTHPGSSIFGQCWYG